LTPRDIHIGVAVAQQASDIFVRKQICTAEDRPWAKLPRYLSILQPPKLSDLDSMDIAHVAAASKMKSIHEKCFD
jgi:hypothetical protein